MDKQRRLQKFSIRKYTVGACSILVGTLIFLSSPTHHAFASENTADATKLEVTEKKKENEVTKTEKEVEETVNTTETTSTNQSATDESTEQPISEEIGKQQVEPEKAESIEDTSKPEESINELENKNEINDKQEAPIKQDTVEEMAKPKVEEASQPIAETSTVKEDKTQNDTVKSEDKTVAKENEQVQKEVVQPEIKEDIQTEKKTTEPEEKLDKNETPNKTAVATEQPREERSTRKKRELRSADNSALRENVNNDTSFDNFVITGKAFGKKANDQEVSDYAHIAHSYVKENGDNVEFHYVIHFNKAESNKARGRFYVYAPSFVKLTPGSIQRVTGSGTFNNWKNKALVTGGSKLNSMVYQAMIPVDRDYYRNLTKITDEDNFYYIHEELNHRRNSYIAKMTATVSKDILRKNNGKFYVAIGVATENIARANRANHVNFIENRANVSDADKFNPKGKEQTVELNEIPNAEQSINTYGLPNGTKYVYTSPIDTSTIGNKNTTVRVSYPDGTHDDVPVVLIVNDTIAPVAPTIENQSIEKDKAINPITIPNATDNSGEIVATSVTGLPTGLNYNNQTNQITGTPTVEGRNDVTVTYTDTSGNTVTKVFKFNVTDTTPPAKPVIQTDLTGKGGTTDPITVQAEPGSKLKLFDKDGNKIGEGIADDQGNAIITPTKPLPEGNITAKATDKAETPNTSEASEPIKVTDTTAPTKPIIQTDLTGKGGTTDPITVQAEPGSKVKLFDKDGNKIGEGETDNNGITTITPTKPLPEGNITAKATDKAENPNTSEASDSMKVTDTTPPAKPVIQTDLTGKGGTTDPITVQSEPGSKVELFDKDGNKIGEGVTDDNGVATITPTKPLPEGNVTAKATDKAENPNTSEASEPMKSTDTTAPTKPVIQTDLTGKGGTTDPITVQAEPGSKVELFDKDGNKIGESETDSNGIATITPTKPLPEGNVTAKATDKAENPNTSEASDSIIVTNPKNTDDTVDNQDSDINGDGKNNKDKEVASTDPTNADTNSNGISDGGEDADKDDISNKDENNPNASTPTNNDGDGQPDATTPSQEPNNNGVDEKPGNNNGSDQTNTGGNEQSKDTDGHGINNKDKETAATDSTESNSNGNGISGGDEDSDKDDISNKDESNPNTSTPTNNDGYGQPDVTKPSQDSNNNDSGQSNTGNNNPNNTDQHKDTNSDNTPNNQDSDIEGNGVNNKDEQVASTDPTKADTDSNGISDDISNKDESNPNASTPTNNDGDEEPNATTPSQNPNNNGSDQTNTGGNEQSKDTDGHGINNKDKETAATDSTESNSNGNGISDGDEDSDKDGISNKDESDSNSTIPTDKDGNGQSDVTKPSQDSNNNGSNQSNTGNNNPNNADQHKDTDGDGTPDNQDSDINGDGINNTNKEISGTNPINSDAKENGALSDEEKSGDSMGSIQPNLDGNVVTNNSSVTDKQSMNKYNKLNSNNDIIKLAAKDDITLEGNGVTNINNELNNDSSMNQQNSNTNLNDQNATNNMSNNDQSSEAHSNSDHEGAKVLPDTGEEESKLAGLLSITSLFGGLALLFRRKKSEDKE